MDTFLGVLFLLPMAILLWTLAGVVIYMMIKQAKEEFRD